MPNATEPSPAEQLADLLDGRLAPDDVPAELVELAELATAVRTHIALVPPTEAFREALREQVVQAATAPTPPTTPPGGGATAAGVTTTGASGGLAGIVAGVAAAAVLATSVVAAADRAGPGDLLAGLDRGLESLQLLVADETRDAELLVDFASERLLEALDLVDGAVVGDLLAEADALLADALDLAVAQGRSVEELVAPYVGALRTLASRSELPEVQAAVVQRLEDLGVDPTVTAPVDGDATVDGSDGPTGDDGATGTDEPVDEDAPGQDDGAGDGTDPVDEVTDPLDDVTDPLDDVTDPLDDVTDPLDDLTDPLDEATEQLVP